MVQTLLTVLTVFSSVVRILITCFRLRAGEVLVGEEAHFMLPPGIPCASSTSGLNYAAFRNLYGLIRSSGGIFHALWIR